MLPWENNIDICMYIAHTTCDFLQHCVPDSLHMSLAHTDISHSTYYENL